MFSKITCAVLLAFVASLKIKAQSTASSQGAAQKPLASIEIQFKGEIPLLSLPNSSAMGYPFHCSLEGDTYVELYAEDSNPQFKAFPDLYRISHLGDVLKVSRTLPSEYTDFSVRSFYAGRYQVSTLIEAQRPVDPLKPRSQKISSFFIITSDPGGASPKLLELDLKFEPLQIGGFDSGGFVVFGIDKVNRVPALALLDEAGSLRKPIDVDNRIYEKSADLPLAYTNTQNSKPSEASLQTALKAASFVPYGKNLLLIQPGSNIEAYVLSPQGSIRSISLKVPTGYLIENALPSEDNTKLFVRARVIQDFARLATKHIVERPKEAILELNSESGEVNRRLDVVGPLPGEVTCAVNHKLTALYYPLKPPTPSLDQKGSMPPVEPKESMVLGLGSINP